MKRIFIIAIALFIGLSVSAQIQNKILGFTLGTSTKNEVRDKYKNEIIFAEEGDDIYVGNLEFAGQTWDITNFRFYDNKLLYVLFSISEPSTPSDIITSAFESYKVKLWDKYSDYYIKDCSTSDFIMYTDNKTYLALTFSDGLSLIYSDCALSEQQMGLEMMNCSKI